MALRHLQLLRNLPINQGRADAKAKAITNSTDLKDGELIVARYLIDPQGSATSANTAVALGFKIVSGGTSYTVFNDPQEVKEMVSAATANTEALEQAVGVGHGESAITFSQNVNYLTSGSAKNALEVLDDKLEEVSGKTDSGVTAFNNYTTGVVGAASGSSGLGATGSNISATDTVLQAVQKLDKAIESGDTANDNLRKAVGAAEGASAMTYATTTKYIKDDTTVKAALETLDANLNTVSGDLDTLESTYAGYTATTDANTADTRTMATNLDTVVGVASGATSLGVNGNYVHTGDSVQSAITALDAKLYEVGSGATLDLENLRNAVGVGSGDSAITITGAHYATGNTVVTALTQLDAQLYTATTKAENAQAALGSTGTTLGASGKYVTSGQTAKAAVETLDSNLFAVSGKADSALTYVGNIDSVVGVQNTATTFATSGTVAGSQTTVKGAVEALDAAIVGLSGSTAKESDLEALIAAVGATKGQTGMTYPSANYIGSDTSVSGALMTLDSTVKGVRDDVNTVSGNVDTVSGDLNTHISNYNTFTGDTNTKINTISGKADNAQTALGTTGTTLGVNGNYVTTSMNVQTAVDTLDDVEKATRDTIGITGSGSGLSLTSTNYMKSATTVVSAVTALDSNLATLSGAVSDNKVNGINPIVTSASTTSGTDIGLKLDTTITDSSVTATAETDIHNNIIKISNEGLYALADVHYNAQTNVLTFINSNGKKDIPLTGTRILASSRYNSTNESLELDFVNFSGGTDTVTIPLAGLLNEFDFKQSTEAGSVEPIADSQATDQNPARHNVYLKQVRNTSGSTEVVGELSIFDCGTY